MNIIDLQEIDVNRSDAKHSIGAPLLPQDPTRIPTALAVEFRASRSVHSGETENFKPEEAP